MFLITFLFIAATIVVSSVTRAWQVASRRRQSVRQFMSDMDYYAAQAESRPTSLSNH